MLCYVSNACKVGRLTLSSTSVRVLSAFILRLAYRRKDRLHLWTRTDHVPLRLMAPPLLQGAVLLFNLRVRGLKAQNTENLPVTAIVTRFSS